AMREGRSLACLAVLARWSASNPRLVDGPRRTPPPGRSTAGIRACLARGEKRSPASRSLPRLRTAGAHQGSRGRANGGNAVRGRTRLGLRKILQNFHGAKEDPRLLMRLFCRRPEARLRERFL